MFHCLLKCLSYCIMFKYCDNILLTTGLGWGTVGHRTKQPMRGMSNFFSIQSQIRPLFKIIFFMEEIHLNSPHIFKQLLFCMQSIAHNLG